LSVAHPPEDYLEQLEQQRLTLRDLQKRYTIIQIPAARLISLCHEGGSQPFDSEFVMSPQRHSFSTHSQRIHKFTDRQRWP
jgi:hypothetical protein